MNVLIIAKFWDSSAGIGALRPMKVAKYLLQKGHNVAVICGSEYSENTNPCRDLLHLRKQSNYIELPAFNYSGVIKKENDYYVRINERALKNKKEIDSDQLKNDYAANSRKRQTLLNRFKWFVYKTSYNSMKVHNTVKNSLRIVNRIPWNPDLILSSYAPEEVHFLAMRIKKLFPDAFWIADFRDPMANSTNQKPYEFRYRLKREKRIIRKADAVTIVSRTWRDELSELGNPNVYSVFSGFDRDDFLGVSSIASTSEKLVFTYTGSLYPGLSDLRPLFKAISELIQDGRILPERLKFVYAGPHGNEFVKQAAELNCYVEIVNHGLVPRNASILLLKESDILLHALFCTPGLRGIITGKLGEYWISERPIVAIVTGTVRADEFISIIENSNTGFVYDGTNEKVSFEKLKMFILEAYKSKNNGIKIPYNCNEQFISNFDYSVIANHFIEIAQGKYQNIE